MSKVKKMRKERYFGIFLGKNNAVQCPTSPV